MLQRSQNFQQLLQNLKQYVFLFWKSSGWTTEKIPPSTKMIKKKVVCSAKELPKEFFMWKTRKQTLKIYIIQFPLPPMIPKIDQHLISPYNISPESHIKAMRVKEMITHCKNSWLLNKLSILFSTFGNV